MKRILFRADANNEIGFGHMVRCLALSQLLNKDFKSSIAMLCPTEEVFNLLKSYKIYLIELNSEDEIFDKIPKFDIIVLDGYQFKSSLQKRLKSYGKKIVCIDDLVDRHYYADLVINHANSVTESQFSTENYTRLCLGEKYTILRSVFYNKEEKNKLLGSVLICFGGADINSWAAFFLDICIKIGRVKRIDVILAGDTLYEQKDLSLNGVKFYKSLTSEEMAYLMRRSQLVIGPSSNIALEALACDCKLLTGLTAENQKNIYEGIKDSKDVCPVGVFNKKNRELYNEKIIHLITNKEPDLRKKYDIGADNLINVFLSLAND